MMYTRRGITEHIKKIAARAAGTELLLLESPTGGSSGGGLDLPRAKRLVDNGDITGELLLEMLTSAAANAAERFEQEFSNLRIEMIGAFEQAAIDADSLSMYRTVQAFKKMGEGENVQG